MRIIDVDTNEQELFNLHKDAIRFAVDRYNETNIAIYRGISTKEGIRNSIEFVDPTARSEPRKSANTHNYYTLWVDNSVRWLNYPKRSYSLICSTDSITAGIYGETYVVIPIEDTPIGICPDEDFWYSFDKTISGHYPSFSLGAFMDWLHVNFQLQKINSPKTFSELNTALKKLDPEKLTDNSPRLKALFAAKGTHEAMNYILSPSANDFRLTTWKQFNITSSQEVWLSAPSILIDKETFRRIAFGNHPVFEL